MKQQPFEDRHRPLWRDLEGWLEDRATLGIEAVPGAYRQLCHHLAMARERHYSPALVETLQQLALRLHQRLYGVRTGDGRAAYRFLVRDLPRQVRSEWRLVLLSAAFLVLPFLAAFLVIRAQPTLVHLVVPQATAARMVELYTPDAAGILDTHGAMRDVMMFGFYIYNNIGIDFQCFASGLLAGIGPVFYLAYNGLQMGAIAAHLTNEGLTRTFYGFVSGHSPFELTGAVLSGSGGLRMGLALIHPGRLRRLEALKAGARKGSGLLIGAACLTLAAAFVEGFWSASPYVPYAVKVGVGLGAWALVLGWLAFAGRGA